MQKGNDMTTRKNGRRNSKRSSLTRLEANRVIDHMRSNMAKYNDPNFHWNDIAREISTVLTLPNISGRSAQSCLVAAGELLGIDVIKRKQKRVLVKQSRVRVCKTSCPESSDWTAVRGQLDGIQSTLDRLEAEFKALCRPQLS